MLDSIDDAELLAAYAGRRGNDAFAELVRRYVGLVYHAALRQGDGDSHTAEDVTQRVFILLAQKAAQLTNHHTIAGWLHATTRYVSAEVRRVERRRRFREQAAYTMQEIASAGARDGEWEQLRPIIDDTLGQLGDGDREIVLLRFFANLPFAQIGARLSVSENAARMRVDRALERLRGLIARRGITSTTAALAVVLESQATAAGIPAGLTVSVTSTVFALGTAPAGVTAIASLTGFMSSLKLSLGVGAAVLVATTLGVATFEFTSHRNHAAALAEAGRTLTALTAQQRDAGYKLLLAEQATAELRRKFDETRATQESATAAAVAAAQAEATVWDPMKQGTIFMERHPSVERALEAYAKARAHFRYAAIYEALGLKPEQIDEFQSLLSRGIGMGAAGSDGHYSNRSLSLVTKGPLPSSTEYRERMRALIGEEGMRKLSEYGLREPGRDLATKVAGELWSTETPLSPQQADALVGVFTQHRSSQAAMAGSRIPGHNWNAILTEANGFLNETQLEVLKGMQARDQFIQAINRSTPASATAKPKETPRK